MSSHTIRYQPYYCEENAYHLCTDPQRPELQGRSPAAVFIRGLGDHCVMWQQGAVAPGEPVFWDYHVVVLAQGPWQIWDLDTRLGCPVPATTYLRRSFRPELTLPPELTPRFRLVDAAELARTFASDRSHMRDPDGRFSQPPPPWPAIGAGKPSTLARFLELADALDRDRGVAGEVEQAGERLILEHVHALVGLLDLLVDVELHQLVDLGHALAPALEQRDGRAGLEDRHVPVGPTLLDLIAMPRLRIDAVHPGVLGHRQVAARLVLLAQLERERDGVVTDLLPAIGVGRARAGRLEHGLLGASASQQRRVRDRLRALDLAAHLLAIDHEVGHGRVLEQLLPSLERLGTDEAHEGLWFEQGEQIFELIQLRSGASRPARASSSYQAITVGPASLACQHRRAVICGMSPGTRECTPTALPVYHGVRRWSTISMLVRERTLRLGKHHGACRSSCTYRVAATHGWPRSRARRTSSIAL